MASRKIKGKLKATLVTGKKEPCAFCLSAVDDEINFGKIYAIGNIQCHYFCVLLSSCLIQRGKDEDGLFGFLYEDIIREVERCKKHKCSYCGRFGAGLGCAITQCRKQFHLSCGKERDSVFMFFGNYKSFCKNHGPRQKIPDTIMVKARLRMKIDKKIKTEQKNFRDLKELSMDGGGDDTHSVCVICYEAVDGYPTVNTFWPPCCARDAWFHRTCLQRMALSAGMHYLKCPLCNDKENFYKAVVNQGYYVPDRDAAWELEQNAFAEIYERSMECAVAECQCPMGRTHDAENGRWELQPCLLCGSSAQHRGCSEQSSSYHVCAVCATAAPADLQPLADSIEKVISSEQRASGAGARAGRVMPSRMSLRRTKPRVDSCSASRPTSHTEHIKTEVASQTASREPQSLETRVPSTDVKLRNHGTPFASPSKLLEQCNSPTKFLLEGVRSFGGTISQIDEQLVAELRNKFRKPKPLCEKRRVLSDILNGVFDSLLHDSRARQCSADSGRDKHTEFQVNPKASEPSADIKPEPVTPTKSELLPTEPQHSETCPILTHKEQSKNMPLVLQFSPRKDKAAREKLSIDVESFKDQYLNEVIKNCREKCTKKQSRKRKMECDELIVKYETKDTKKKREKNISINNKNIKVKIQWKKQELELKITDKNIKKNFKQYVLQCTPESKGSISKPCGDVTPIKKKKIKSDKSPDNLVQTNIEKFFKVQAPSEK